MAEDSPNPAPDNAPRFTTVTLSAPIVRGETQIATLTLRKPRAGELRGLTLTDIMGSDITALLTLIPRITDPILTPHEADQLEADDLSEIGGAIRGFFMSRSERAMIEAFVASHQPTGHQPTVADQPPKA